MTLSLPRLAARVALTLVIAATTLAVRIPAATAAARVFVAVASAGKIFELDPATGATINSFALQAPAGVSTLRPGLAFNGSKLFYTETGLSVIQVYSPTGTLLGTLPRPTDPSNGTEPGTGLGVSKTSLFLISIDGILTKIDPDTGAVQGAPIQVPFAHEGLTFAGSRGTLFACLPESNTIVEIDTNGVQVNSFTTAVALRGLGFSSTLNRLYGVSGPNLYILQPDGTPIAGPIAVVDPATAQFVNKTGAAAADEIADFCGDQVVNPLPGETCDPPGSEVSPGVLCRADCTYCGDGVTNGGEQCDDGNTTNGDGCSATCQSERCGDQVVQPSLGETCEPPGSTVPDTNGQLCRADCTYCGDGTKNPGEACDDGNNTNEDGCNAGCVQEFCGDGILQPGLGEVCEPSLDPECLPNCRFPEICFDLVDNDGDGLIDCCDPDCDCALIGRDPGVIRFGAPFEGHDLFAVHGSFIPTTPVDPHTEKVSFQLTNANGVFYQIEVPVGSIQQRSRHLFRLRDRNAQKKRSGLFRLDIRFFPRDNRFTFLVKSYGDLSGATQADIALQFVIGDDAFNNVSIWSARPFGWLLQLPGGQLPQCPALLD